MADGFIPQTSLEEEHRHNNELSHEAAETTDANLATEPADEAPPNLKAKGVAGRKRKLRKQSAKAKADSEPMAEIDSAIYVPLRQASTEDMQRALPMLRDMGLEVFANAEWGKGQGILKEYTRVVWEAGYISPLSQLGTDKKHLAKLWELPSGSMNVRRMSKLRKYTAFFHAKSHRDGFRASEAKDPVHEAVATILAPLLHPNRPDIIPFYLANAYAIEWRRIEGGGEQSDVDWLGLVHHDLNDELIGKMLPGSPTHVGPYVYQLGRDQGLISDEDDEEEDRLDYEVQLAAVRDSIVNNVDNEEVNTGGLAVELAPEPEIPIEEGVAKKKAMTDDTPPKKKTKYLIDLSAASTECEEFASVEVSESPSKSDDSSSSDVVYKASLEATHDDKKFEEEFPAFKNWEAELATLSTVVERLKVGARGFMGVCEQAAEMHEENMKLYQALDSESAHDALRVVGMQKEQIEGLSSQIAETNIKLEEMEGLRKQVANMNIKLKEIPDLRGQLAEKNMKLEEMEGLRGQVADKKMKLEEMEGFFHGQLNSLGKDIAKLQSHISKVESEKKKVLEEVVTLQAVMATTEENKRAIVGEYLQAHKTLDDKLERTLEAIYRGTVDVTEEVTLEHRNLIATQVTRLKSFFRDFTNIGNKLSRNYDSAGGNGSTASPFFPSSSAM